MAGFQVITEDALTFLVDDLAKTERELRVAGLAPTLQKDLVTIGGPEGSLIAFTIKPAH